MTEIAGKTNLIFVKSRLTLIFIAAATWGGSFIYAPFSHSGPVLCPMHGLTGLPCPGCGMTRAFCALTRLDFATAAHWNLLAFPLAAIFIIGPLVSAYEIYSGRPWKPFSFMYSMKTGYVFGAFIGVYHITRCIIWSHNGILLNEFIKTSWTYSLLHYFKVF